MELEYARSSLINLSSSSSLIPNNLCVARALRDETSVSYGVVHKGTANIVHVSVGGEPALKEVDYEPTKDKDPMAYLTQVSVQIPVPVLVSDLHNDAYLREFQVELLVGIY